MADLAAGEHATPTTLARVMQTCDHIRLDRTLEHSLLASVPHTAAAAPRADSVTAVLPGPPKKRRRGGSTTKNAATIIKNCVKSIVKRVVKTYDREVTVQVKLLLKFMVQRVATTPEQLHAQQEERLRELRARRMSQDFNMTMRAAKAAGVRGHLCHAPPVSSDLEHHRPVGHALGPTVATQAATQLAASGTAPPAVSLDVFAANVATRFGALFTDPYNMQARNSQRALQWLGELLAQDQDRVPYEQRFTAVFGELLGFLLCGYMVLHENVCSIPSSPTAYFLYETKHAAWLNVECRKAFLTLVPDASAKGCWVAFRMLEVLAHTQFLRLAWSRSKEIENEWAEPGVADMPRLPLVRACAL